MLLYASELGLIGKEHFAVDGCKLPSNASKQWSGTHRELQEKRKKLERVAERIDPNGVVETALGPIASAETRAAVARAESRQQALALAFMSPEFQRR